MQQVRSDTFCAVTFSVITRLGKADRSVTSAK